MRLKKLHIKEKGFKNLKDIRIDFEQANGISVLIGNNGSGKSNLLEAISNIFAHLYKKVDKLKPDFDYELTYKIEQFVIFIDFTDAEYTFKINDIDATLLEEKHLPTQVIANYSGEESRLWEKYYKPFYDDYTSSLKSSSKSDTKQPLLFINKYYWNIALLTFFFYDFEGETPNEDVKEFCTETLKIEKIEKIVLEFDTKQISKWQTNTIKSFVETINPENEKEKKYSFTEFKNLISKIIGNDQRYLFNLLSAAFMPKASKLITKIELLFGNNLSAEDLSEGEKKLILIQSILETLSEANTLILFDEPDSHIHISRKSELKKLLEKYGSRDNVLTTHSPTLAHSFDLDNINMLSQNNGSVKIVDKEKQKIISELTNDIWSYQEQNIFLNSRKDLIIVEGKTDITYLSTALEKLKSDPKYSSLDFDFLPTNGAEGLSSFIDKFTPRDGQIIISFLDRDSDGLKSAKAVLNKEDIDLKTFKYEKVKDFNIAMYPITNDWTSDNFVVEDYFAKSIFKKEVDKLINSHSSSFKYIPNIGKQIKKNFPDNCKEYEKGDFEGFKKVFDLILEIKANA